MTSSGKSPSSLRDEAVLDAAGRLKVEPWDHWILDLLDIAIVAPQSLQSYMFIHTRAVTMFLGLLLITGGRLPRQLLNLHELNQSEA